MIAYANDVVTSRIGTDKHKAVSIVRGNERVFSLNILMLQPIEHKPERNIVHRRIIKANNINPTPHTLKRALKNIIMI